MKTVYIYVLDTLADWELAYLLAELNSKRFFKKSAPTISLKMVGSSLTPIHTMGGLKIKPDCLVQDIPIDGDTLLVLPGADQWNAPTHLPVLKLAQKILKVEGCVAAICGATAALANAGILDDRPHTSNGPGFLEMVAPNYRGQNNYKDVPSLSQRGLISANSTAGLLWTKQILSYLEVFQADALDSWYDYFHTGEAKHYFSLMTCLSKQ